MKGERKMVDLIKILPLILTIAISCSPIESLPEPEKVDIGEVSPTNNLVNADNNLTSNGENLKLDLDKQFIPLEYELEEAYPFLQFDHPLLLTNAKDGSDSIYVVEQGGKIKYFNNDVRVETANIFLDLSNKVDSRSSEKGLLGLAFHPNYKENGYFYVNYTDRNSSIIARYSRIDDKDEGDINSEEVLLKFEQPYSNHNGGHLEFGPDGYLYIATGDGGSGGDPQNNSQNLENLLGKILRIDVDNITENRPYSIPEDNPFKGKADSYREEIYAYGLRNPWRFSFDNQRNTIIAADVGQNSIEEINIIKNGRNYGWRLMEGSSLYSAEDPIPDDLIPPIWEYDHRQGKSVTGGYTYYGKDNPSLYGVYIYGDFISGRIWGLWLDKDLNVQSHELISSDLMISSFGLDEKEEIYIVDYSGKIYRIIEK